MTECQALDELEKLGTTYETWVKSTEKELDEFCDVCLKSDSEIEAYCRRVNIPWTVEGEISIIENV